MPKERVLDPRPIYYTYVLFDWLGVPRYVGKGGRTLRREEDHWKKTDPTNQLKNEFIAQTWTMLDEIPHIRIRENISEREAFETEIVIIKALGRLDIGTGILTNRTDGGDGAAGSIQSELSRLFKSEKLTRYLELLSPEERSARSQKAWDSRTEERKSEIGRKRSNHMTHEERVTTSGAWAERFTPEERSQKAREAQLNRTPESRSASAKLGFDNRSEEAKNALQFIAPAEVRSATTKKWLSQKTPNELRDSALKIWEARRRNGTDKDKRSPEEKRASALKTWKTRRERQRP